MGSIESVITASDDSKEKRPKQLWQIIDQDLTRKIVTINKAKYLFGKDALGSGAFGEVYPARRSIDDAPVAIKVVSLVTSNVDQTVLADAFLNEVRQSIRLSTESRHVVRMFDFDFHSNGLSFIVMERGQLDLEKTFKNQTSVPITQQKSLWKQIVNILITLHNHSIVHLDLKPSNLVFFGDRLKLVDLGIAQKANTPAQGPNGTHGFSAPEVVKASGRNRSRYSHKSDVWSGGAILYWFNYLDAPKYSPMNSSHQPPKGILPVKDPNLQDLLRRTLRTNPYQRPEPNWLANHPFLRSH